MLKTKLKASAITNLTDARYFAAWEVTWLGFNLDSNAENYIAPISAKAIKEWVDGVEIVGEFGLQTAEEITQTANLLELETIQVGQFADIEMVKKLADFSIIKEIIIDKSTTEIELLDQIQDFAPYCSHFLLDFSKNGFTWSDLKDGKILSLELIKNICKKHAILMAINCPPAELDSLLIELNPVGLNVQGGEEEQIGMKSFDELDEIFEAIEILV